LGVPRAPAFGAGPGCLFQAAQQRLNGLFTSIPHAVILTEMNSPALEFSERTISPKVECFEMYNSLTIEMILTSMYSYNPHICFRDY
jgi:hypothetical protein